MPHEKVEKVSVPQIKGITIEKGKPTSQDTVEIRSLGNPKKISVKTI
jgi:hypothetical protein